MRYNGVARILHWTIATLVLTNLATGLTHEALDDVIRLMPTHKAIGLTVLALTLARIGWRFTWKQPSWPGSMPLWQRAAASTVHASFYLLLLALPVSGWIMSSASKYPLNWFGLVDVPKFAIVADGPVHEGARFAHEWTGWLMLALVAVHVAAALWHQFGLRDGMLRRML